MQYLYKHYDKNNVLLYVGIALNPLARLNGHKLESTWFNDIYMITIDKYETRQEVLTKERESIKILKPRFNIYHSKIKPDYYNEQLNKLIMDTSLQGQYNVFIHKVNNAINRKMFCAEYSISKAKISRILSCKQKIDFDMIEKLSKFCGIKFSVSTKGKPN